MSFINDLKTDQRTQILIGGIVFFAIAFPVYFSIAADGVESFSGDGPIGTYEVSGEYSYHVIGSGSEYVNNNEEANIIVNSDAAGDEIKGKNIVGVRATLSFSDDEQGTGIACTGYDSADDDVTGHLMYVSFEESSQVQSGESVMIEWHDSSIVGTTVENMSESMIEMLLDGMGIGLGEHMLDIGVSVNTGGGTGLCGSDDEGEQVDYVIELISLDYTITYIEE